MVENGEDEKYEHIRELLTTTADKWKTYKNQNRIGAYGISLTIIALGVFSAYLGISDGKKQENRTWVVISGALIVAAQGVEETFKFKSREQKYRTAQKALDIEILKFELDPENFDLNAIKAKIGELNDF